MDPSRADSAGAAAPAQLAKAALRRLALAKLEPTPDNYSRAYAEESAGTIPLLPQRLAPLLSQLITRWCDDAAQRDELAAALMHGRWDQATQALDTIGAESQQQGPAWAALLERLLRALEHPSRQWTAARRRDSLQRVLGGSRSDMQRLQQRLQSLIAAWEGDAALPEGVMGDAPEPAAMVAAPAAPQAEAHWPELVDGLGRTVQAALPESEPRARALADRLGELAQQVARRGASAALVVEVAAVCDEARRLFEHRHRLVDELSELCRELARGLTEISEDDSWTQGQSVNVQQRLADVPSLRNVRAAQELLAQTRQRQHALRAERQQARDALKALIQRMLGELVELGAHTDRFQETIGRHAEAVQRADSLESLAGVVREMVADSRAVQLAVNDARQRLQGEHARASELESRVRELEAELRRVSDEATTDALTQVANRRGLVAAFETEVARVARAGSQPPPLSLALIDIDNFKKLNDSLGHAAGDQALKALSAAVKQRLRSGDQLARFGGEEFVILLPGTGAAEAQDLLTRLQRSLSASLFMHDEREVFVTFSAGVTAWRDGEALDSALERADEALYEAKRTGKNRTCAA